MHTFKAKSGTQLAALLLGVFKDNKDFCYKMRM